MIPSSLGSTVKMPLSAQAAISTKSTAITPRPLPKPPGIMRRNRSWPRRRTSSRLGCGPRPRPHGLWPPPHGPPPLPPPPWFCHGIACVLLGARRALPLQFAGFRLYDSHPTQQLVGAALPDRGARLRCQEREDAMSGLSEQHVLAALRQVID